MECNKDEAKRAMDIAERKVTAKDYNGAKKFANKAQTLYPQLEGLKQLMMTVDVYISGEKQIGGEADWYGILGVDPYADDEAVRKQYRKLALMLHPDKNKCTGAEGAFKLLSEAWSLLSDKARRFSYNLKRQVGEAPQRFTTTQTGVPVPPRPPSSNGFQNARNHVSSSARARTKPGARMDRSRVDPPASVAPVKESCTFWTMCNRCTTQYEYLRVYLNQTLLCPNCQEGFIAAEKNPPATVSRPVNLSSSQQHRSSKNQAANKKTSSGREHAPSASRGFQWESWSRMANSGNATKQAPNSAHQAQDKLKRGFGESQERDASRGFTNSDLRNFKKPRTDDSHMFGPSKSSTPSNPAKGYTETPTTIGSRHPHIQRMLLPYDIKKALMNKAQSVIFKRLPKMISDMAEDVKAIEREKKSMKATSKMTSKANEVERNGGTVNEVSSDSEPEKDAKVNAITVPDSDFHNFDLGRSENSFRDDEIWAAYDDDDGMPRFYSRIQKVLSMNPFKLRISWLNTKTCREFGALDWTASGFAKSCGEFRVGKYEPTDALNAFSHKVDFTKGARGLLYILPKKGQVWALYRNWSPEWDKETTPGEVIHKYDMVEVLDNYTDDKQDVTVVLLLKTEGFRALFRRSTEQNDVRKIPKEEMFRFSHQVPHYILTGKEADNAPEGFMELDPAATPCELLPENDEVKDSSTMDVEKSEPIKEKSSAPKEEMGMNLD
uniref:DnaJ-like protein subfamily B member 12 n=1 Tax=Noccaea caerulescens TaxID=107243 RepID=A0A1J3CUR3_NOCCA